MFVALQIPIVDGRRFDPTDATRLKKPTWAGVRDAGGQFLRSMGAVRERRGGTVDHWLTEEIYCSAARWLKFPPGGPTRLMAGSRSLGACWPAFRRWMGDGRLVFRLETGWRVRVDSALAPGEVPLEQLLRSFLGTEVQLGPPAARKPARLFDLPQRAFEAYRSVSTRWQTALGPGGAALVRPGQVLLYLELLAGEAEEAWMQRGWRRVELDPAVAAGFRIWTARIPAGGRSIVVYCVHRTGGPAADLADARALRLNLLRMHAEVEGLDELLRWQGDPDLAGALNDNRALVNEHLEVAMKRLRPDRGGSAETRGFRLARRAVETGGNGRIDVVLEEIQLRIESPSVRLNGILHALHKAPGVRNLAIDMSTNKTQNTTSITGNVTGSSISVAQAGAHGTATASAVLNRPGVRAALADLEKAVTATVAQLDDDEQKRELEQRLKDLKKEGKERKWYEVSAEGLLDAAKAVGEIAGPIVAATTTFLGLLA